MTRKKSNVKALALAVTCAILAGGYSGLNPVYAAADTLYKDGSGNVTTAASTSSGGSSTNNEAISALEIAGVRIGTKTTATTSKPETGRIEANNIKVSQFLTVGTQLAVPKIVGLSSITSSTEVDVNGVKFASSGAITASSLKLSDSEGNAYDVSANIESIKGDLQTNKNNYSTLSNKVTTNETDISDLKTTVGDVSGGLVKDVADNKTAIQANATAIATKANQTELDTANGKITALEGKTTNISYDATNEITTVDGVKFKAGAVSGVSGINGDIIKFMQNGAKDTVQINSDLMLNDNSGGKAATLSVEGLSALNSMVYDADGKINNGTDGKPIIQAGNGSKVGGVTLDQGAVSDVKSINGNIKISDDGSTVTFNKGISTDQVEISATGIKVGTGSAYINNDGFKAGADGQNSLTTSGLTAKTINAGTNNNEFTVDEDGNTNVGGTLNVTGETTLKGNLDVTGNITGADITATGALKGQSLGIGGTANDKFTVDADGAVKAADGKVEIDKTGKATFGNLAGNITTIDGQKITTGSIVATDTTVASNISGVQMLDGKITASNMEITGAISLNDLTVNNQLTVGTFSVDKTGVVKNLTSINDVAVAKNGAGLKIGSATVGDTNPFSSTGFTVDATGNIDAKNITASTYNGNIIGTDNKFNGVELKGGDVKATKVTADTITDGTAIMTGGTVTANTITVNTSASLAGVTFDASGVDFNGKDIKNVANVTATTAKLGNLSIAGHVIKNDVEAGGPIGLGTTVTVNNAGELGGITKIDGVNVIDNAGGLAIGTGATQVTIGGTDAISVGTGTFTVDGAGLVTGNQFATTNGSYLKDNELKLNAANIWNTTEGLKAEKAVIGANTLDAAGISTTGTLGVKGQATFGHSTSGNYTTVNGGKVDITANGGTTTIEGAKITTETLDVKDIILRNEMQDGAGNTITIKGSDGSMSVAGGAFAVDKEGQLTNKITGTAGGFSYETNLETSKSGIKANYTNAINGNQNTIDMGASGISIGVSGTTPSVGAGFKAELEKATMGYGTENSIVVNKDTIKSALGTDVTRVMTNSATEQSIVDKVGTDASRTLKATEIVDEAGGMTITTNNTGTTFSNGTNTTLINGSAITSTNGAATGVLNGSNLTLTNGANSTALTAGGATFTGAAGEKGSPTTTINGGTITTDTLNVDRINLGGEVIDKGAAGVEASSKLYMDAQGNFRAAEGNFTVKGGTGTDRGALHNKVGNTSFDTTETGASMKYNNGTVESNVSVGDNSAMISAGTSAGASSIKVKSDGITNTGKTTFKGAVDSSVPTSETTIDGNTIKTGHLITDKLTITGSGNADGTGSTPGSIAFGGDGTITSNIKDGTKEVTFKTDKTGTFTHAKDGANETTNTVNAQGNTNVVTDGTNTSTATQKATSIGGVVTNGTVKMSQELTVDGVKFEQTDYDEVNIAKGDVTVKNNRNTATPNQEVHLSDLGSLNNLDGELKARDEYQDNKTAVGAINAEAGIRREEVARLDNRIDDVNNRVDKVGAMAAAIASLKSIGYDPQAPSEFSIGLGQYKGETGVAMGFFHYPNKNFMINVSLSTAGGETMGGIGATWRFGHKSPQKLLDEQREAQARKELAAAEKYQAAAKLAKEAQERAEYAAKLARQAQVSADNAKAAADATQAKHFQ